MDWRQIGAKPFLTAWSHPPAPIDPLNIATVVTVLSVSITGLEEGDNMRTDGSGPAVYVFSIIKPIHII